MERLLPVPLLSISPRLKSEFSVHPFLQLFSFPLPSLDKFLLPVKKVHLAPTLTWFTGDQRRKRACLLLETLIVDLGHLSLQRLDRVPSVQTLVSFNFLTVLQQFSRFWAEDWCLLHFFEFVLEGLSGFLLSLLF